MLHANTSSHAKKIDVVNWEPSDIYNHGITIRHINQKIMRSFLPIDLICGAYRITLMRDQLTACNLEPWRLTHFLIRRYSLDERNRYRINQVE